MASDTKEEVSSRNQVGENHTTVPDIYECLFNVPREVLQAQASILHVKEIAGSTAAGGREGIADDLSRLCPMELLVHRDVLTEPGPNLSHFPLACGHGRDQKYWLGIAKFANITEQTGFQVIFAFFFLLSCLV